MGIKERKEREKRQRKEMIINAAQQVFFTKGVNNTTMDDIAQQAELAKGTLYLYFNTKEELEYGICMKGTNMMMDKMLEVVEDSDTGLENLLAVGWAFIDFSRKEPDFFNFIMMFQNVELKQLNIPMEEIEAYFLEQSPLKLIHDLVLKGVSDGSIRSDLPSNDIATTLWSQMMGLLIVQQYKKEIYEIFKVDRDQVLKTNFEIIINGIAGPNKNK